MGRPHLTIARKATTGSDTAEASVELRWVEWVERFVRCDRYSNYSFTLEWVLHLWPTLASTSCPIRAINKERIFESLRADNSGLINGRFSSHDSTYGRLCRRKTFAYFTHFSYYSFELFFDYCDRKKRIISLRNGFIIDSDVTIEWKTIAGIAGTAKA